MTRGDTVDCDQCKTAIYPSVVERPLAIGGVRQEFTCPACGAIYPVVAITKSGLRLRGQLGHMRRTGQTASPEYANALRRYQRQVRRLAATAAATPNGATPTPTPSSPKRRRR